MQLRKIWPIAPLAVLALGLTPGTALADEAISIDLEELNSSGVTGSATVTAMDNGDLHVWIEASGMTPNSPHAQHLHGATDGTDFHCPTMDADADGDGFLTTTEGVPDYGDVFISLTTEGDTTVDSALAVDRFPVADADGNLSYERTISAAELPEDTLENLRDLHVVQHGVDFDGNGKYDGDRMSDLDESLPAEATDPASCGMITGAGAGTHPDGGVDTGAGTTEGTESTGLMLFGGAAIAAAGGALLVQRRLARVS